MARPIRLTGAIWLLLPMVALSLGACVASTDTPPTTVSAATTTSASIETTTTAVEATTTAVEATTTATEITTTSVTVSSTSTTIRQLPAYEIFEFQDVSFPGAVRYVAHVLAEPGTSVGQLTEIAQLVAEGIRLDAPYQALSVGFYDYPEYFGFGFVMGRIEFAPFGDWGRADEVELGDYSTFDSRSFLNEKDWSQRPSQEEVTIWRRWEAVINELDPDLERDDVLALEMEGYEEVAKEFNLAVAEVEEAVQKAAFWPFS